MPVAVFRRYTPPTCTLELRGERSPLSVWSDRPIVKQVQFVLNIDGPQRPTEQRVTLKGGRTQLDHLHDVVNVYVQHTLGLSAQQFQMTILQAPTPHQSTSSFPPSPATTGQALASPGRINDLGWARATSPDITLAPKGALKHELQLGHLSPHSSIPSVVLSTTELFDLAHALDSYHGEVDSIPELNPVQRRSISPWMKGAAAAVLAIGVTASLVNILQLSSPNASFQSATGESADSLNEGGEQQLAQRPASTSLPTIELDDIPSAIEALPPAEKNREEREKSPADESSGADSKDLDADAQPKQVAEQEEAIARSPSTTDLAPPNSISANETRLDTTQATIPQPNAQSSSTATDSVNRPNGIARSQVASTPLPAEIAAAGTRPRPLGADVNTEAATEASRIPGSATSELGGIALNSAELPPELTSIPPIPTVESGLDPLADNIEPRPSPAPPSPSRQTTPSVSRSGAAQSDPKEPQAHSVSAENQRAEVQTYFESEWQPPDGLNQALQYRLVFNADGSLQQTIPLGESARAYRSNVTLPATGDPFVSPFGGNDTPPMRLFLGANGQVRVFIESLD